MPRPRSKPTSPRIKAAAKKTALRHLTRLTIDVSSWSEQGMGPTDGAESRRKHAIAFVANALDPDAPDHILLIARKIALPIAKETADRRTDPNARRDQILIDAVQLVCEQYTLKPTRGSGQAESGCSIVAEALPVFLRWLRKCPDKLLARLADSPEYCERRKWADTELRRLPGKLFPEGELSEERLNNIWDERPRS
jgi:hypothetical protein